MNRWFCEDYYRMTGRRFKFWGQGIIDLLLRYDLRYMLFLRIKGNSLFLETLFQSLFFKIWFGGF